MVGREVNLQNIRKVLKTDIDKKPTTLRTIQVITFFVILSRSLL